MVWFHEIHFIEWKNHQMDIHGNDGQTRKQTVSSPEPDTLWPEIWKDMSEASKRNEKQKWTIEKSRRLRDIYFIDLDDNEFKCPMKNARTKLENSDASSDTL